MIHPYSSRWRFDAHRVTALLVTLAPLIYFWPAVQGKIVISPDDGVIFNIPLRVAAANLIRSGQLPLWNPYLFSGMPLHGAAQAGVLFPLNWFYLIASPPVATNLMMLATYMLAALGAYLYARRAGADLTGAIVTSVVWQFSAFMIEQVGHTNILHTAAMLPWLLWSVEGYVASASRKRAVLLAVLVAVQVFAGHQQTCAYSLLLTGAYTVVLLARKKTSPANYLRPLALFLIGLTLSAVQTLPTLELLRHSLRATASYDFFSSFSMPPRFILTLFAPYVFGGGNGQIFRAPYVGPTFFGEYAAYVGLLTLMLAVLGVALKRDRRTKFWTVVVVISLLLAFGRFLPFHAYVLVYYVPVLNLFRVPARHLMEVEFALAVLAGRGITALTVSKQLRHPRTLMAAVVGGGVFLLTVLTVSVWRPADFRLARQAPLTLMRAPELFVPIAMAVLSVLALWKFSYSKRRRANVFLLFVLVLDLAVYGQASGWRTNSPTRESELWREPATVAYLREHDPDSPYRILTEDQPFDPSLPVPPPGPPSDWLLSLQPDIYMMHGIENAAGYDGFGMSRYSRLMGDMKVWGELTDAERSLRGETRELDLMNVRYLLTRPLATPSSKTPPASATPDAHEATAAATPPGDFLPASQEFEGTKFAPEDLNLSGLGRGALLSFVTPPVAVDALGLVSNLSWSVGLPDGAAVAQIKLFSEDHKTFELTLQAGQHTAEWAHDRPDIQSQIKHRRPPVATSYKVDGGSGSYEAHSYVAKLPLPERAVITGGEIKVAQEANAPDLLLAVLRVSLVDRNSQAAFALRREWFTRKVTAPAGKKTSEPKRDETQPAEPAPPPERWKKLSQLGNVVVFENTRALPRAWLANEALALDESQILEVIRSGRLPSGETWEPKRTALTEVQTDFTTTSPDESSTVEFKTREPNYINLATRSGAAALLVVSENHFPGWRAYVDGSPVETLRVDYNLRGVLLAAGNHQVEFSYRPKSALIGLVISLLTAIALVLWCLRLFRFLSPSPLGEGGVRAYSTPN